MNSSNQPRYAGFWIRLLAALIDSLLLLAVILPLLLWVYGWQYLEPGSAIRGPMDLLISWVLPCLAAVACWRYRSATPGKMIVSAWIVDQRQRASAVAGPVHHPLLRLRCVGGSAGARVPLDRLRPAKAGLARQAFRHGRDPRTAGRHSGRQGRIGLVGGGAAGAGRQSEPLVGQPFDLSDPATAWPEPAVAQATSRYSFPGVAVPEAVVVESSGPSRPRYCSAGYFCSFLAILRCRAVEEVQPQFVRQCEAVAEHVGQLVGHRLHPQRVSDHFAQLLPPETHWKCSISSAASMAIDIARFFGT